MYQVVSDESRDAPINSVVEWNKILPGIKSEHQSKDISDASEPSLFYHLMLNWTLAYEGEKVKIALHDSFE